MTSDAARYVLAEADEMTGGEMALLARIDPGSEAGARATIRAARESASEALIAVAISDEQAEHVRSVLASLERDLGRALPLPSW